MKALIATIALIASANAAAWDSGFAGGFLNSYNNQPKQQQQKPLLWQNETYFDKYNNNVGRSTTDQLGNTTYYDRNNNYVGTKRKW